MESYGRHLFFNIRFYLLPCQIPLVGTAEVELVAVFLRLHAAQDGTELRQVHLANASQLVVHLLLLELELLFVGQVLPLAAATHAEVLAERSRAYLTIFYESYHFALGKRMFLASQLYVADIAGHTPRHEHHHVLPVEQALTLCRHSFYRHALKQRQRFLVSCHE